MLLDQVDKQILNLLFKDGRGTLSSLSKIVKKSNQDSMSHAGISKRISRMKKLGFLKVQGNLSIKALNYTFAFILMEMKNFEELQKISEEYAECPRIFLLAHLTGQFNLIMGIVGQDIDVLRTYLNYCGPTNKKGILHSVILFTSNSILPEFVPINLFSGVSKEHECGNICKECEAFLDGICESCGNF
jgi:DNA-binding Lrp family transcriptional regulator